MRDEGAYGVSCKPPRNTISCILGAGSRKTTNDVKHGKNEKKKKRESEDVMGKHGSWSTGK